MTGYNYSRFFSYQQFTRITSPGPLTYTNESVSIRTNKQTNTADISKTWDFASFTLA